MQNIKHKHDWEVTALHYTGDPSVIECKICHKASFPGKQSGVKSNRGCFGKCHKEVSNLTEVDNQRKLLKLEKQNA